MTTTCSHRKLQSAAGSRPYTSIPRIQQQYPMYSYTVKVYHISMSVSAQQLESIFKQYGACRVNLRHPKTDEEQHAYVSYTDMKEAQRAARGMNGAILHGERITARVEGHSSGSLPKNNIVKVENLAGSTSEETLEAVFWFHKVLGITIKNPAVGPNYAYIYYSNEKDAQAAVSELNSIRVDEFNVQVKLHTLEERMEFECEPLIVLIMTSPDRPEYRSQIQTIERTKLVSIQPMKSGKGFELKGNAETLEEVKSHLELITSQLQERLNYEQFTLPHTCLPFFTDHKITKQIKTTERQHDVEFYVCSTHKSIKMTEFPILTYTSPPGATHQNVDTVSRSASTMTTESASDFLVAASTDSEDDQSHINVKVRGFKDNLAEAISALKAIFNN